MKCTNHYQKMDRFVIKKGRKIGEAGDGERQSAVRTDTGDGQTQRDERNRGREREDQYADPEEGTSSHTESQNKKRKARSIQDEHRKFQDTWTDEFLFVLHNTAPLCLLCNETRACFKRSNLERHLKTAHPQFNVKNTPLAVAKGRVK